MTKVNREKYAWARELIAAGRFTVYPEPGLIVGPSGRTVGSVSRYGYVVVGFDRPGHTSKPWVMAHRMIWEFVHGPIEDPLEINHINGVKTDNRIANLECVTPAENKQHAWRTGLNVPKFGEQHPSSILTDAQVREVFERVWNGESSPDVAADYGISRSTVSMIYAGKLRPQLTRQLLAEHGVTGKPPARPGKRSNLSPSAVRAIRAAEGRNADIGALYGVSASYVSMVKRRIRCADVE